MTEKRYKGKIKVGNKIGDYIIDNINKNKIKCHCVWCGNTYLTSKSILEYGQYVKCHKCPDLQSQHLYSIWREMNRRCYSENCDNYKKYGAIGIKVCKEWLRDCDGGKDGYLNFKIWADNNGYKKGLTLDRKNPYEDYSPENCRWATYNIQNTHLTISRLNTSGYVGVCWINHKGQYGWRSRIKVNKKEINLGVFPAKKEALDARNNYIISHNLPQLVQKYVGKNGYNKEKYKEVFD